MQSSRDVEATTHVITSCAHVLQQENAPSAVNYVSRTKGASQEQQWTITQEQSRHGNRATKQKSNQQSRSKEPQQKPCRRCGKVHQQHECPVYELACLACSKANHFARLCRQKSFNEVQHSQVCTLNSNEKDNDDIFLLLKPQGQQIA